MMRYIGIIALAMFFYGAFNIWKQRPIKYVPGVLVTGEPLQTNINPPRTITYKNMKMDLLAEYQINARVLSTEWYKMDPTAPYAPIDLALGWGPMSDTSIIQKLNIHQGARFFTYSWRGEPPISVTDIETHASNNHIIPANNEIDAKIKKIRVGELVTLTGYLVSLHIPGGGRPWKSSLVRTDTGDGACEIIYVTKVVP